jgi:hypothetical protein
VKASTDESARTAMGEPVSSVLRNKQPATNGAVSAPSRESTWHALIEPGAEAATN